MGTFAGIEFPTLPTGTLQCSNRQFLNEYNDLGSVNVNAFYEATQNYGNLTNEIYYKLSNEDDYTYQNAINDLNSYRNYLNQGLITLGNNGTTGTSVGGFTGWYWGLAENTGWFGQGKPASCDETRNWCMFRHATGQNIRHTYFDKMGNSAELIELFTTAQADSLAVAEIESEIAVIQNNNTQDDAQTEKNITDLKNSQFATYVEMFAIAGAVLILAYTGYKTLKR